MWISGRLDSWNDEKGYGFISPAGGGDRVFVHISAFNGIAGRPAVGQSLSFVLSTDRQGRPCAGKVVAKGEKFMRQRVGRPRPKLLPLIGALGFLGLVAAAVHAGKLPMMMFVYYLLISLITYVSYALDKYAARKGAWRTRESTLHLFALAGGWPGALLAQQSLRHKSSKTAFLVAFWVTAVLNSVVFFVFISSAGQKWLRFHDLIG